MTAALWTSADAITATGGTSSAEWQATGISIDTRSLEPGDLFVALSDVRDGHDFVAQAFKNGAAAALVSRVPEGVDADAPLLLVDDVLQALEKMAVFARERTTAKVVAITGSVGKTSTKEMLRTILGSQGRVHAAEKSFNNHWGVPVTLARMPANADFAVIEIGMNHPGEIAPLTQLAQPHIGIVTNVGPVHLEAFEDVAAIAREKAAIFEGVVPGGTAIFNGDMEVSDILAAAATEAGIKHQVKFGENPDNQIVMTSIRLTETATVFQGHWDGERFLAKLPAPGRHFALNALAVLAAAKIAGADIDIAIADLGNWQVPGGRGNRQTIVLDIVEDHLTFELLDDAFNANPASMAAAIEVLAAAIPRHDIGRVARGRRIAVLGDMLELGDSEMALHQSISSYRGMDSVDVVHCVGRRMKALYDAVPPQQRGEWHADATEMVSRAHAIVDAGDVVLVKGSKGSRVSLIVDALKKLGQPLA